MLTLPIGNIEFGGERLREQERAFDDSSRGVALDLDAVIEELGRVVADVRHGSVTLIVQGGQVVQIDVTRKLRLERRRPGSSRTGRSG
jgi:hypothetical protein